MTDSLMHKVNMQAIANLPIWFNMAAQVYVPSKVLLVGAGNGTGPLVQGLLGLKAMPLHTHLQAHLIEADSLALSQLARKLETEAWTLSQEVVAPDQASTNPDFNAYYQYSLSTESGLLPPESLKSLWPNIQLRNKESCASSVLLSSFLPASWLMIDCLPAGQLLQGVHLDQVDVLMARVVFDEIEKSPLGSSFFELDEKLNSQGFKLFACFTERNTSLGKALWLRDSAKQLDQEKAAVQQLTKLKAELQAKLDAEVQSRAQEVQSLRLEKVALEQDRARVQEKLDTELQAKQTTISKLAVLQKQFDDLNNKQVLLEEKRKNLILQQEALKKQLFNAEGQIDLIKGLIKQKFIDEK